MSTIVKIETVEIIVTGMPGSGKSTFIKTICPRSRELHGWYTGDLSVDDELRLKFLEPPKLKQFDFIWLRELIEHVNVPGFVVMCDSTQPEYFGAVVCLLETIKAYHPETPCILVANKHDDPRAWHVDDIRLGLGIPDSIPVVPCIASEFEYVKDVIIKMLYQIFE